LIAIIITSATRFLRNLNLMIGENSQGELLSLLGAFEL
jgi:hypothetical protein